MKHQHTPQPQTHAKLFTDHVNTKTTKTGRKLQWPIMSQHQPCDPQVTPSSPRRALCAHTWVRVGSVWSIWTRSQRGTFPQVISHCGRLKDVYSHHLFRLYTVSFYTGDIVQPSDSDHTEHTVVQCYSVLLWLFIHKKPSSDSLGLTLVLVSLLSLHGLTISRPVFHH